MNERISVDSAPRAIGPYSQAVVSGGFIFASGMLPIDPSTGKMEGDDITVQARRVFSNIKTLLASRNLTLGAVVKTTVFLKNMDDFAAMNEVYADEFSGVADVLPARSAVQVSRLPKDSLIEIEFIASDNR